MKQCYVVLQISGEYSDAIASAIGVFESQEVALAALKDVGVEQKEWQGPYGHVELFLEHDSDDTRYDIERVPFGQLEALVKETT